MSTRRVLVFAPFNPYPPSNGLHHRLLQMLRALRALGYHITLAGSTLPTESKWNASSQHALTAQCVDAVNVYSATANDYRVQRLARELYRRAKHTPPLSNWQDAPPGMRRWFARLIERAQPDVLIMNYAYWDALIDHVKQHARWRVIDTIDLVTVFEGLQETLKHALVDSPHTTKEQARVLTLEYIKQITPAPAPREFQVYNQYSVAIGITRRDTEMIARHAPDTRARLLAATVPPVPLANTYAGAALFALGPNLFNLHGYMLFTANVLPEIRSHAPAFHLDVTGTFFARRAPNPTESVALRGFVPNLDSFYQNARLFVCPTAAGTGQQIKILEAMAHGLGVVAFRRAAENSPLVHGESGLIADGAPEFAAHVIRLWNDQELCARLGRAARAQIAADTASGRFENELQEILTP